jgi:hypothetical protein
VQREGTQEHVQREGAQEHVQREGAQEHVQRVGWRVWWKEELTRGPPRLRCRRLGKEATDAMEGCTWAGKAEERTKCNTKNEVVRGGRKGGHRMGSRAGLRREVRGVVVAGKIAMA